MSDIRRSGERVDGLDVPVLSEREIRAAAGIRFLATLPSLLLILFRGSVLPIRFVIPFLLEGFPVRVGLRPRFSPTRILGRRIVGSQSPEYAAAEPKRLARAIGVVPSATLFVLMVRINTCSPVTGNVRLVCLVFLFFESAFGICPGCGFYRLVSRKAWSCVPARCAR